jgi:hypothetical protein
VLKFGHLSFERLAAGASFNCHKPLKNIELLPVRGLASNGAAIANSDEM